MSSESVKRFFSNFWEVAEVVLIAFVVVYVVRTFVAHPFLVSGASMEPTYKNGEYLLVDELTYRFRQPERGEVIVFRYPGDEKSFFIKRIIGLPNEKITIANNHVVIALATSSTTIELSESYLPATTQTSGQESVTLGNDQYFVMGDNRGNSFDSRSWGPLKQNEITGLVRLRLFPFDRFDVITTPTYSYAP